MHLITPVILAGGSGERLWPLSKIDYPKQFVLFSADGQNAGHSLFQESVKRVADRTLFSAPIVLCNEEHRFIITEQLRYIGIDDASILIEPVSRNTAPALTLAAIHMEKSRGHGVMLVMPSDHKIGDTAAFLRAVKAAHSAASEGWLLTFGISPDAPETGYGYIKSGEPLAGNAGIYHIARFVEKPDYETAVSYLKEGGYAWNSGMFMMHSTRVLSELQTYEPAILAACRASYDSHHIDQNFMRLDKDALLACPSQSIDYAIMEHTTLGAILPVEMQWCDLGSWTSMCAISEKDENGNAIVGPAITLDSHDCYIRTHNSLVATIGVDNLVVVSANNAILIGPKERMQDIKQLVKQMRDANMPDIMLTSFSHRPWGKFYSIDQGDNYQVKRLHLKPGGKISLQSHQQRSEHWIVVHGRATVTNGDRVFSLDANQSTYISAGTIHRLENREQYELIVIEVQTGPYLGEDDIKRYEDVYNREQ